MTIKRNFAFPKPGAAPVGDLDSHDALAGLTASRDSAGDFQRAQAAATGEQGGGSAGFELESGELQTTGSVPADSNEQSVTTTGGSNDLVVRDTLPQDSNMQAGGAAI